MASLPSTQKAFFLEAKFGKLNVRATSVAKPGPGQLLIKVEVAVLNQGDWKVQAYNVLELVETYPAIMGWDLSGTVVAVGEGTTVFAIGDRVISQAGYDANQRAMNGTFIQYFVADARFVVKIPDTLAFEEAATVPSGVATAALSLYNQDRAADSARLTPPWVEAGRQKYAGNPVCVVGGATSVGQYVRLSGFSPITSGRLRALGATHVLDRTLHTDTLQAQAARIAGGDGFRVMYDTAASPETGRMAYALTARGGDLVMTLPSKAVQEMATTDRGAKRVHVSFGAMYVPYLANAATALLSRLPELLASGTIQPCRVNVVPGGLDGIVDGLDALKNGKVHARKLAVRPYETA
ncbi:hypothetical protein V8D89_009893 [Ganoderma adspersum]